MTYAPDDLLAALRYLNGQGAPWDALRLCWRRRAHRLGRLSRWPRRPGRAIPRGWMIEDIGEAADLGSLAAQI